LALAANKAREVVQTAGVPRCPKCLAAGSVQIVEVTFDATTVFDPLPHGWDKVAVYKEFRCGCGWSTPVLPGQEPLLDPNQSGHQQTGP
jgi:hypothetical protein